MAWSNRKIASSQQDCGYTHWTGEPTTPDSHALVRIPQSTADGWQGFCSCGEWRTFKSFYDFGRREDLLAAIGVEFDAHVAAVSEAKP